MAMPTWLVTEGYLLAPWPATGWRQLSLPHHTQSDRCKPRDGARTPASVFLRGVLMTILHWVTRAVGPRLRWWMGSSDTLALDIAMLETLIPLVFLYVAERTCDLHSLSKFLFQLLYEPLVPLEISSHMCPFSFTMLNRALIKRFTISSWILSRRRGGKKKKKSHIIARNSCHKRKIGK